MGCFGSKMDGGANLWADAKATWRGNEDSSAHSQVESLNVSDDSIIDTANFKEQHYSRVPLLLWNDYAVVRFLGAGVSGEVYLCMDIRTKRLYAIKVIQSKVKNSVNLFQSKESDCHPVSTEARVLNRLGRHENIVGMREIIHDLARSRVLLVMEYYEGGPLFDRNQMKLRHHVSEHVARAYVREIINGLLFLHEQRVIHSDLKLENILLNRYGRVGLTDFGCSTEFDVDDHVCRRKGGTPAFQAPEILHGRGTYSGKAADAYALGVCLYVLLYSRLPYIGQSVSEFSENLKKSELTIPEFPLVSDSGKDVLRGLLEKDPSKRLTLAKLLEHPWISDSRSDVCPIGCHVGEEFRSFLGSISAGKDCASTRTFSLGEYACRQGQANTGKIGVVVEGELDLITTVLLESTDGSHMRNEGSSVSSINSRDLFQWSGFPPSNEGSFSSEESSSSSESEYQVPKEVQRSVEEARAILKDMQTQSGNCIIEKVTAPCIIGEKGLFSPALPSQYSAVVRSKTAKVRWITYELYRKYMETDEYAYRGTQSLYFSRQYMLDKVLGLTMLASLSNKDHPND